MLAIIKLSLSKRLAILCALYGYTTSHYSVHRICEAFDVGYCILGVKTDLFGLEFPRYCRITKIPSKKLMLSEGNGAVDGT